MLPPSTTSSSPTPKSASDASVRAFANVASLLLLTGCLWVADASAGKRKKKKPEPVVVQPKPAKETSTPLFDEPLPIGAGAIPKGLANLSAQGCAACHFDTHADWLQSAHATAWSSAAFTEAVATAADPACTNCHLPLIEQRPVLYAIEDNTVQTSAHSPNPAFDATLRTEGVTCAVCHLREGRILSATPKQDRGKAPHPVVWSEDLNTSKACAPCHQLQWPGANAAFYDTWGEWKASPWSRAGVQCQDCHGGAEAGARGFDHGDTNDRRALSILIDVPTLEIVRGGEPVPLELTLQNTGAGHAYPTGSPFSGVEVVVALVGPPKPKSKSKSASTVEMLTHALRREFEPTAPWNITSDTRVAAGATTTLETALTLPHEAPIGAWQLRVQLWKTIRGERTDELLRQTELPVDVR